jgi:hypothetical protein
MSLSIKGRIAQILPVQSGVSKAGNEWSKQDFVIETVEDQFPRKVCFTLFGDKVSLLNGVQLNDEIDVAFNLESREFNGKWFTNVNAWRINPAQPATSNASPSGSSYGEIPPPPLPEYPSGGEPPLNDLPF